MKKGFKIVLVISFLGFLVFGADSVLAIEAPTNLTPCGGEVLLGLAVWLDWEGETVDHYELYYKLAEEDFWTDRYPSISKYHLTELIPSPKLPKNPTVYQWYVVSCADPDCAISAPSQTCFFTSPTLLPENGGKKPGNGNGLPPGNGFIPGLTNPLNATSVEAVADSLINFLFVLVMGLAPLLIIYAALLMLTSGGDPEKVNRAKQVILWTVIAVAVALFAKGLPALIQAALGG